MGERIAMIEIIESKGLFGRTDYITSNVGEIVRLTCEYPRGQGDGEFFCLFDSKGESFHACIKPNAVRYYSLATVTPQRKELLPTKYRSLRMDELWCGDPRVVWLFITSLWLWQNGDKRRKATPREDVEKYLNANLPDYTEAAVWVVKNRFILTPTKVVQRDSEYLEDYGALRYPPEVDWSLFPDQERV